MPLTTLFLDKLPSLSPVLSAHLSASHRLPPYLSQRSEEMFPQKDMPDLRIEPATSCTAVERGYDRASQAGIYFTLPLGRTTNGYDQDLSVLAKYSLIWIYTDFYAYTWPFKIIDNVVYYTPPQVSGWVLWGYMAGYMAAVFPSVRCLYVHPSVRTSFPIDSLSIYKRISFKVCICICTNNVSLGIVNGQISIIYHSYDTCQCTEMVFGL